MKPLAFTSLAAALLFLTTAFLPAPPNKGEVLLNCNLNACNKIDSLFLYEFNGVVFKKIQTAPTADWQNYQFKVAATAPRFYYVGIEGNNIKPLILGTEQQVTMNGSCQQFQGAQLPDSELNKQYEEVKNAINQHKNELTNYLRQMQAANAQDNVDMANSIILKLGELDNKRLELLDYMKKTNPYLSKVVALNTYLSYQNHGSSDVDELTYFATKYFDFVDWKDPDYNYMPWVYESIKGYAQTLASVNFPVATQKDFMDRILQQIPATSRTYMLALGGAIAGFQAAKSPLMADYGKRFMEKYKSTEPEAIAQIQQMLKMSSSNIIGGEAPDFTMNDLDGKPRKLSEFKGKVMLVDFWASWCGPCRRENPNVLKAYAKYHEKGFDVLGVSLDKTKESWLAAIEKDGLIWHHVSDLKGWQNEAAKLYGVTSIPHTVLLDKEGKIIARNLRGEALDAKLAEIFGE
jgi:peroxiredoxin